MTVRFEIEPQFTHAAEKDRERLGSLTGDLKLLDSGRDSLCFADVVADGSSMAAFRRADRYTPALQTDILSFCREELSLHKVPAAINFVPDLAVGESGKRRRVHA